jgi:hypothetical protein
MSSRSGLGRKVQQKRYSVGPSDEQRLDWLRLIRSQNVGPRGIMAQTPEGSDQSSFEVM